LESIAVQFPSLTRIKNYEELFIGAIGLMNQIPPQGQVDDALMFCCDVMEQTEAINEKLNLNLRLKIAVNTGGPVLYGTMSPKVPAFEVFGELVTETQKLL
jgi:class 3 adenylate cyclase